jgi:hypothetical protein
MKKNARYIRNPPRDLASQLRGLYGRVARELHLDTSYVSRVARGERQSDAVEAGLRRELKRIVSNIRKYRKDLGHKDRKSANKQR